MFSAPVNLFADRRFLLIDDFDAMRGILRSLLRRCGAQTIDTAANARDALQLLQKSKYDVVLCDYNLGGGKTGQNILEEARHDKLVGPATVWIMITAEKTSEMISAVAEHAPDDYLVKPIIEATLSNRLQKLVLRKSMLADIGAAVGAKQYGRALELCAQRLAQDKGNPMEVLRIQADLFQRLGQTDEARRLYEGILTRLPAPWAKLGLAKLSFQEKDHGRARSLLEEIVAAHPQYVEAYDWLARLHRLQQAPEAEESVLQKAVLLSPNSPTRQAALGAAALRNGRLDGAESAFRRSIKLAEQSALKTPAAHLGLARTQSAQGKTQEALRVLADVARDFPADEARLQAKAEEARVWHAAGEPAKAAEAARAVSSAIQNGATTLGAGAVLELAETLMTIGERGDAAQLLQFIARNHDDDEPLLAQAQVVFDRSGIGNEGRELLGRSRQQAREAMNEGVGLLAQGQLDDALARMRDAATLMPRNARVMLNLAYVLVVMLEKRGWRRDLDDDARRALAAARQLAPEEKRIGELLARLERACSAKPSSSPPAS